MIAPSPKPRGPPCLCHSVAASQVSQDAQECGLQGGDAASVVLSTPRPERGGGSASPVGDGVGTGTELEVFRRRGCVGSGWRAAGLDEPARATHPPGGGTRRSGAWRRAYE